MDFEDSEPLSLTAWPISAPGSTGFRSFITGTVGLYLLLRLFTNFINNLTFSGG